MRRCVIGRDSIGKAPKLFDLEYIVAGGREGELKRIREETRAKELGRKVEAHQCRQWGEPPRRTFDELMLMYLDGPGAEKRSAERDHYSATHLYPVFTGLDLNDLSPADIRTYIDDRKKAGAKPGTINREIGLLSAAL